MNKPLSMPPFRTSALFLIGALICVLRNPLVFFHPIAGWEDGTQGINIYDCPDAPLIHFYSGYVQAWPNLIYRLIMFAVPLPWVPYALSLVALAVTAIVVPAAYSFVHYALELELLPSVICSIIVGIVPAGDWLIMSNVDYSIWPIAAILILCAWTPIPTHIIGKLFYFAWRALAVATNPLSLPLVAVWAVFIVRAKRRGDQIIYFTLTTEALIYTIFGITHQSNITSSLVRVSVEALRLAAQSSLLALCPGAVLLGSWPPLWLLAIILTATLSAVTLIRRRPKEVAVFSIGIGAICMICAIGRGGQYLATYLITATRYAYVPRLLWCCLIAATLAELWRRFPGVIARLGIAGMCTILLVVQVAGRSQAYAWNDVPASDRLLRFLSEANVRLKAGQPGPFKLVRIDSFGDWSIIIAGPSNK